MTNPTRMGTVRSAEHLDALPENMTDPTRTRHEWDCGDTRVVRTADETGQVSVWVEAAHGGRRLPITEDMLVAAAAAIRFDTANRHLYRKEGS